jgi:hypothetical protein
MSFAWFKYGSQKYRKMFLRKIIWYLTCIQIWLNLHMDDGHFGYVTKLIEKTIASLFPAGYE